MYECVLQFTHWKQDHFVIVVIKEINSKQDVLVVKFSAITSQKLNFYK